MAMGDVRTAPFTVY